MTSRRIATGGLIDRSKPLDFTFDGKAYSGFAGDTLASALLGAGVRVVGRSFKYHRPRGVWGGWSDDPNAIFDVKLNGVTKPNVQGVTTLLEDGMVLRSVNAFPSANFDIKAGLDLFSRFLPAGFYYKMFMWPDWHLFEPSIRKMAGMGRVGTDMAADPDSLQLHDHCDVLVVGAGPSGLAAARAAAETGEDVLLVDDHPELGGSLRDDPTEMDGLPSAEWIAIQKQAIVAAGGQIMSQTTAFGIYDHGLVSLHEAAAFNDHPKLHRLRVKRIILATGALDRPVAFGNNDRPGIMSLRGATSYLNRYGVLVGDDISIVASEEDADHFAPALTAQGAKVRHIDPLSNGLRAIGRKSLTALAYDGNRLSTDAALCAAGQTPHIHLWCHVGGKLDWDQQRACFVPGSGPDTMIVIGAARGASDLETCVADGVAAANRQRPPALPQISAIPNNWPRKSKNRQWIDFQSDVTLKDVELAARENFASVEHLKRYTTLGMSTDQGKTSNINGLAALANQLDKPIPEVGTTKFRPPYVPVPLQLYHGARSTTQIAPLKRSALEPQSRALNAAMAEYGGWLRPAWYGDDMADCIRTECLRARAAAGIMDASSLGKIEVMGPDATDFLNFVYYNTMRTLKVGGVRYGFMLTERGAIYDDGVLSRLGENHYVVSSSSSHVEGVTALLEAWRQDGNDPDRIFIHDVTQHWATVTITGPKSREIVVGLNLGIELDAEAFPHMTIREGSYSGHAVRVARVSFTGDLSFEISIARARAPALWDEAMQIGEPLGAGPLGMEALAILRAEKGFIVIGKDTDGDSIPPDLGFTAPRDKKTSAYVGDRGLKTDNAMGQNRQQLIGLTVPDDAPLLPVGAHVIDEQDRSIGFVTSSYESPNLGRPIAMALLRGGRSLHDQEVKLHHLGKTRRATVTDPCVFDPKGDRLNA